MECLSTQFSEQQGSPAGLPSVGHALLLTTEPLLIKLKGDLSGICFPHCDVIFKLSVYADDMVTKH